jgi:hypothetical protein
MSAIILYVALVSAGIVAFASFCRLTKTSVRTITSVRLGIWLLATSALAVLVAPLAGWSPDILHAALLLALAVHQVATRRTWQHGVPHWFTREDGTCPRH